MGRYSESNRVKGQTKSLNQLKLFTVMAFTETVPLRVEKAWRQCRPSANS